MNTLTTTNNNEITPFQEQASEIVQYPAHADQAKTEMHEQLNAWLQFAEETEDAPLHGAVVMLLSRSSQLHDYVHKQGAVIGTLMHATDRLTKQRDAMAEDLEKIDDALENPWQLSLPPKVEQAYERVTESHNEAFWESLPYDMADVLGDGWDFIYADKLYTGLTLDLFEYDEGVAEEVLPDEHGISLENLLMFRRELLNLVKAYLMGGE